MKETEGFYAEDVAPTQLPPEQSTDPAQLLKYKSRAELAEPTFENLLTREDADFMRIAITYHTKGSNRSGLALKLFRGTTEEQIKEWLIQAAEALHRHLNIKDLVALGHSFEEAHKIEEKK